MMTLHVIRADMDKMLKLAVSAYGWNDDATLTLAVRRISRLARVERWRLKRMGG
jgi:hypothetical protein